MADTKPVMLIVMDGWGISPHTEHNAIAIANTPNYDAATDAGPFTTIRTSGTDVGLPARVMGNSEVGHLNLGAGRVVWQDIMRITNAIVDGEFQKNPALMGLVDFAKKHDGRLHFMGLLSDGNVHSCDEHFIALLRFAAQHGFTGDKCVFHCLMDGRDTPPTSGVGYVQQLWNKMAIYGTGIIGSVSGRFWGMDRDKRWDRVRKAWDAIIDGKGAHTHTDAVKAVQEAYRRTKEDGSPETDEFIEPTVIVDDAGNPVGKLSDGDALFFFNFRADRAREFSQALVGNDFNPPEFEGVTRPHIAYATMTEYIKGLPAPIAFEKVNMTGLLTHILAEHNKKQLRIAETEKYAHVTFFFSGGVEQAVDGEDRILVASPREVATYDQKPEMSAPEVCEKAIAAIESGRYDAIILNFANCDMVGHTGVESAAVKAVETVDHCIGKIGKTLEAVGGIALVTADHGNAEQMWDYEQDEPYTAHTTNPVPLFMIGRNASSYALKSGGRLADISPTLLDLLGLEKSGGMTGESLLLKKPSN